MLRPITLISALLLLAGCATVPAPLEGEYSAMSPEGARSEAAHGVPVRWGGTIVDVSPLADETCVELLARPLDRSARPLDTDTNDGRFIACKPGFLDPAAFANGRELTVVGELDGARSGTIGEYEYSYPLVRADAVYLWPERSEYDRPYRYRDPFLYDPFLRPHPYFHSFWYGRYHGPFPKSADAGDGGKQ